MSHLMQLLDGKAVAAQKRQEIAENIEEFILSQQLAPGLVVVLVGEDPASQVYVRNKIKACEQVGVMEILKHYDISIEGKLAVVGRLNIVGKPMALLGKNDFKRAAVVVDVGMHREVIDGKTKLCGDVRFEELDGWVSAATPVPGGVGPMTITMLLHNTLQLAKQRLDCSLR